MTEFTSERIKKYREYLQSINPDHSSHTVVASLVLDEIEKLQQRVQELEQERRWISVEERLPKYKDLVITLVNSRIYDGFVPGAGYWMYRPMLPKKKEEE